MEWLRLASSAPETRHVDFLSVAPCLLQGRLALTLRSYDNWNPFDHTAPMIEPDKSLNSFSATVRDVTPAADNGFATRGCAFLSTEMRAER